MRSNPLQPIAVMMLCAIALAVACCRADDVRPDRPMYWLSGDRSPAGSSLRRALRVPGLKCPVEEMSPVEMSALYLDMNRSFGVKDRADFRSRAYEVLDAAVSAERRLEEAWKSADRTNDRYRAAYYFLKYRLRFAEALAKVEISIRMAGTGSSSYCIQAMESAIDCLKSAAEARDEFEKLKEPHGYRKVTDLPASMIRECREDLLRAWHSSKSQGDLAPIRDTDIELILNQVAVRSVKDVKARKEVDGLFDWLGVSSAGNHPESGSVE